MCSCGKCAGNLGVAKGEPGENGFCIPIINATYAEAEELKSQSLLERGSTYFITDKNVYIYATEANAFAAEGTVKATNVDFQSVSGNFLGIWQGTTTITMTTSNEFGYGEIITGSISGAIAEVVVDDGNDGLAICVISKNGIAFQNGENLSGNGGGVGTNILSVTTTAILGGIGRGSLVAWDNIHYQNITGAATIMHPRYDATNWLALPFTDTSYQIEYDRIIYDFANARIIERADRRGNRVVQTLQYGDDSIANFQWGRTGTRNNTITGMQWYGANALTAYQHVTADDGRLVIQESRAIDYSTFLNRTTALMWGSTDKSRCMNINHSNITVFADADVANLRTDQYSTISIGPSCVASDCYLKRCFIRMTTSSLTYCHIEGSTSPRNLNFVNETHDGKVYIQDNYSTFQKNLTQAFGLTALTLDVSEFYGRYYLTITGGAATLTTVVNMPPEIPVEVIMAGSNQAILVHNTGATNPRLSGGLNVILKSATPDWIELTSKNSIIYQTNIGQY